MACRRRPRILRTFPSGTRTSVRVVHGLTSTQKGAIAEVEVERAAVRLGFVVARPTTEGRRYDLIVDTGTRLYRVQCKWGAVKNNVVNIATRTSRHTPRGYVHTTYSAAEVDLIAVYAAGIDRIFAIPIAELEGQTHLHLRLAPCRNNQSIGVKWAEQYDFGAVAQLGERRAGSAKVTGSSPVSSTHEEAVHPGGLFVT